MSENLIDKILEAKCSECNALCVPMQKCSMHGGALFCFRCYIIHLLSHDIWADALRGRA